MGVPTHHGEERPWRCQGGVAPRSAAALGCCRLSVSSDPVVVQRLRLHGSLPPYCDRNWSPLLCLLCLRSFQRTAFAVRGSMSVYCRWRI